MQRHAPLDLVIALGVGRVAFGWRFRAIGARLLLWVFVALPLDLPGRRLGKRAILGAGLGLMAGGS